MTESSQIRHTENSPPHAHKSRTHKRGKEREMKTNATPAMAPNSHHVRSPRQNTAPAAHTTPQSINHHHATKSPPIQPTTNEENTHTHTHTKGQNPPQPSTSLRATRTSGTNSCGNTEPHPKRLFIFTGCFDRPILDRLEHQPRSRTPVPVRRAQPLEGHLPPPDMQNPSTTPRFYRFHLGARRSLERRRRNDVVARNSTGIFANDLERDQSARAQEARASEDTPIAGKSQGVRSGYILLSLVRLWGGERRGGGYS